jgi:excisionase family DNA binding protein
MNQRTYLTVEEVSAHLRLPKRTVWRLIRDKELPASRFGKFYRIERRDLEEYEKKSRSVESDTEELLWAG